MFEPKHRFYTCLTLNNHSKRLFYKFIQIFFVRFCISLINRSYIVADEVWQSQEVAHFFVFGRGYLCWEWRRKIRSFLYPMLLSIPYFLLKALYLDTPLSIRFMNNAFGSLVGAAVDFCTYWIGCEMYSKEIGEGYLLLSMANPYNFTHQSRTFINVLEGLINVLFWMSYAVKIQWERFSLIIAVIGCILRPTFAINCMIPLVIVIGKEFLKKRMNAIRLIFGYAVIFALTSVCIDYAFYKEIVPSWWNFIKFNILDDLSSFYGVNDKFWYFWNAIPSLLTVGLIPFLYGFRKNWRTDSFFKQIMLMLFIPNLMLYSLLKHKEVRFIFQLQPFALLFIAKTIYYSFPYKKLFVFFYLTVSIPIAIHFAMFHEIGPLKMLDRVDELTRNQEAPFVLFLTTCHVTHYHCYLHNARIRLEMVSCDPPLCAKENTSAYRNEMLKLFASPVSESKKIFEQFSNSYPNVVVTKRKLLDLANGELEEYLLQLGYKIDSIFQKSSFSLSPTEHDDMIVFVKEL